MFILFFSPAATGWHTLENDAIDTMPIRRHKGKWDHTAARTVASWLTAPTKQVVSTYGTVAELVNAGKASCCTANLVMAMPAMIAVAGSSPAGPTGLITRFVVL